jgi:hypothetical protein
MLYELVCHHIAKNKKRYFILGSRSYRIGKALDNDIVLLESDAPSHLGVIEKNVSCYVIQKNGASIDLMEENAKFHGYRLSILDHRRWFFALVFTGIFSVSLMFFQWKSGLDSSTIGSTLNLPARGVYGNASNHSISSLVFEFQFNSSKYLALHYTPGNINHSTDLEIQINGQFLSYAPPSPDLWNIEQTVYIPENLLKVGRNIGNFTFIPKPTAPWAVRDVYIEELDEQPFEQSAPDMIKTAQKIFRERGARKGNLVRAQQILIQAQQSFKRKNEFEPKEIKEMQISIDMEKKQMIQDHRLLIQKYRRQGEMKKATKVYLKLLEELIDPMDPDRLEFESEQRSQG